MTKVTPTQILSSKTGMTLEEIEKLSDDEKWAIIYSVPKKDPDNRYHVCFTGFDADKKEYLIGLIASSETFRKVKGVTKGLKFLVCGDREPGPVKIKKAKQQGVQILNEAEYLQLIKTGELP